MLLSIDPGNDTGWAVFDSARRLQSCGLSSEGRTTDPPEQAFDRILVEVPKYRGRVEKNPQSLLVLSRTAGRWAGRFDRFGPVEYLIPNDWKSTTPKDVSHRRIFMRLAPEEIRALVVGCKGISPKSSVIDEAVRVGLSKADKRANVLDAIGIGLFGVHR